MANEFFRPVLPRAGEGIGVLPFSFLEGVGSPYEPLGPPPPIFGGNGLPPYEP